MLQKKKKPRQELVVSWDEEMDFGGWEAKAAKVHRKSTGEEKAAQK